MVNVYCERLWVVIIELHGKRGWVGLLWQDSLKNVINVAKHSPNLSEIVMFMAAKEMEWHEFWKNCSLGTLVYVGVLLLRVLVQSQLDMLSSLVKEHQAKQAYRKEKQGLCDFVDIWSPQKMTVSCSLKGILFFNVGTPRFVWHRAQKQVSQGEIAELESNFTQ
jgi:hypothetical protein